MLFDIKIKFKNKKILGRQFKSFIFCKMVESEGFNKEKFIGKIERNLQDKYEIIKEIDSGDFSQCLQVINKNTGLLYS